MRPLQSGEPGRQYTGRSSSLPVFEQTFHDLAPGGSCDALIRNDTLSPFFSPAGIAMRSASSSGASDFLTLLGPLLVVAEVKPFLHTANEGTREHSTSHISNGFCCGVAGVNPVLHTANVSRWARKFGASRRGCTPISIPSTWRRPSSSSH